MSDIYNGRSARRSVNVETFGFKSKSSKNEILEKLLALLTTDVQDLAKSLWDILDSDNEGTKVNSNELAELKRENEDLRRDLEIKRKDEDVRAELERKYEDILKSADNEMKMRREYEEKCQELKQRSKTALEALQNENCLLKETIKKQNKEIQALQQADSKEKVMLNSRDDHRAKEQKEKEKNAALEKQHRTIKEKLKKTEEELDETKTRLSQALGLKLLDSNPNIADLSDKYRPTKLAEIYMEIYDKEWTDAFECISKKEGDDEKTVVSALVSILLETKYVCEKEAEKQMEQIQLALTQDENQVDTSIILNINKQLKDCRKQVATYSGKQVYKKYIKDLKYSTSSTARKAKLVPEYLEACFNVCWLMTVQDPPVVFGPNIKRGDTFDTDLYKAYTKSGKEVEYVVWPALLLYKSGPVLCKGVAQGIVDLSSRPMSAPNIDKKKEYRSDEIDRFFSSSDRYNRGYEDDISVTEVDRNDDMLSSNEKDFRREDGYERRDSSNQTYLTKYKSTKSTYGREIKPDLRNEFSSRGYHISDSLSVLNGDRTHSSHYDSGLDYGRDFQYPQNKPYNSYQSLTRSSSYRSKVESYTTPKYTGRTGVNRKRSAWH